MQRCDLLVRGGAVVDGTEAPRRRADVAVQGDRIASVGALDEWVGEVTLEAAGLVVAPGFIDMHSHSDLALLIEGRAESKLRQGVTTEVIGQCGFSPAPAPRDRSAEWQGIPGWMAGHVDWSWESFGQYLAALGRAGISVNVVPVVGHNMVRAAAMGQYDRPPTSEELTAMRRAVQAAMAEGAFGLSTGLVYAPGVFAQADEIVALCQAMEGRGTYFSHIRSEGAGLLEAISEAAQIGREAGVPVQIAHLKATPRPYWGRTEQALGLIEGLRERGEADVCYDAYPYTAWNTALAQLLPAWAREGGGEALAARLEDAATRARLRASLAEEAEADPGRWEQRIVGSVEGPENRDLQGLTLAAAAQRRRQAPEDLVLDLLLEERGEVGMIGYGMCEEDVRRVIAHPLGLIGSDAAAAAPYGVLGGTFPHPRTYGTFPRLLGRYVREERALSLEEAVAKITGRAAARLGLDDRGRIAEGMAADLVVFDPEGVADRADYAHPHVYPAGIRCVVVNGVLELDGEEHRNRRPGRVLTRPL